MATTLDGANDLSKIKGIKEVNNPPTIWTTNGDNNLASPDAYSEEGDDSFISELTQSFTGGKSSGSLFGNLTSGLGSVGDGVRNALKNVTTVTHSITSEAKSVTQAVESKISGIAGISLGTVRKVGMALDTPPISKIARATGLTAKINGVESKLSHVNQQVYNSINGVSSLINEFSSAANNTANTALSITDSVSKSVYGAGLYVEAAKNGLKNTYGAITNNYKTMDDQSALYQFADNILPTSISTLDFSSIKSMANDLGGDHLEQLLSPIKDIAKSYTTIKSSISGISRINTNNPFGTLRNNGSFVSRISTDWDPKYEEEDTNEADNFNQFTDVVKDVSGDDWLYARNQLSEGIVDKNTINLSNLNPSNKRFAEILNKGALETSTYSINRSNDLDSDNKAVIDSASNTLTSDLKYLRAVPIINNGSVSDYIQNQFPNTLVKDNIIKV